MHPETPNGDGRVGPGPTVPHPFEPTSRHPEQVYVVRWSRREWQAESNGRASFHTRWYVQYAAAHRYARRLADTGAVVFIDAYMARHLDRHEHTAPPAEHLGPVEGVF